MIQRLNGTLQAIIFDLDDTLMVEEPGAEAAFMEICKQAEQRCGVDANRLCAVVRETARDIWYQSPARSYCVEIGISSWEGLVARFEGDDPNLRMLREWAPYYRLDTWNGALAKCGVDSIDLAGQLADAFPRNRRTHYALYEDAVYCLDEFSEVYPLALLTNGPPDLQREKIEITGIGKYFTEIVVSGEVGYGKPDCRSYQLVLSRLGVKPDATVYIGDSLESDILGANAIGMKTVWVNRHGLSRDESIVPDLEVSNLREVVAAFIRLADDSE
jgi:putative hydrolase of the HAD superfamily